MVFIKTFIGGKEKVQLATGYKPRGFLFGFIRGKEKIRWMLDRKPAGFTG